MQPAVRRHLVPGRYDLAHQFRVLSGTPALRKERRLRALPRQQFQNAWYAPPHRVYPIGRRASSIAEAEQVVRLTEVVERQQNVHDTSVTKSACNGSDMPA